MMRAKLSEPKSTILTPPAELETATSKLLYVYLSAKSDATIEEIHTELDLQRLTLFPVLKKLEDANLIDRTGDTVSITRTRSLHH